jgi:hypothetical protein
MDLKLHNVAITDNNQMRQCNETLNIVHEIPEMCIETTYMCYITRTNNAVREQKKDHPITEQSFKFVWKL